MTEEVFDQEEIQRLLDAYNTSTTMTDRTSSTINSLQYLLRFSDYLHENPEISLYLRRKCGQIEDETNENVANELVPFEQASELICLVMKVYEMTDFVADFSYDDAPELEDEFSMVENMTDLLTIDDGVCEFNAHDRFIYDKHDPIVEELTSINMDSY